ncbi:MAG TPA: dioxygenase [Vicinamibacterales bacterium]|nr:dioxygenase [Vicinamibacterales bacterium]
MTPQTQPFHPHQLLAQVVATFGGADPRLREIMQAAVRHLHAFAREVDLTTDERRAGVLFMTAVGQMSDEVRQEFELLSDTLGLSSLVETSATPGGGTLQTLTGPFYAAGSPHRDFGESMIERDDGAPKAILRGQVTDVHGTPISGATVDVWQNAANRLYAVQDPEQPEFNLRGIYSTDENGRYEIGTIKPVSYPIPSDGPVGQMLDATGRHPWRAAHIHLLVEADGFVPLTTEVFDEESNYLESDAVFGVAPELILPFEPDGDDSYAAVFNIVLREAKKSFS